MKGPRIPSVFRVFRSKDPQQFEYRPRYYNEAKERIEERYAEIEKEMEMGEEEKLVMKEQVRFRHEMQDKWVRDHRSRTTRSANIRLLIIFLFLCLLCYIIFVYLDRVG